MQSDTALVRADGGVELISVASVYPDFALVVHPTDAELYPAFGFNYPIYNAGSHDVRTPFDHGLKRFKNFTHRLQKFRLIGVPFANVFVDFCKILTFECYILPPDSTNWLYYITLNAILQYKSRII